MRRAILTIAAAAALLLTAAPPASAGETRCVGTLGPGTVDNLLVPSGGTCRLFGTQVRGNVRVEADARFDASSADIAGNVDCERAPANSSQCRLRNRTRVGGSIKLLEGVTSSTSDGVRIDGDVTCDRCRRSDLGSGTEVGGDVQVKEATEGSVNTGGSPGAARLSVGGDVELLASRGGLTLFNTDGRATSRSRATPASWWWATPASQTSSAGTSRFSRTTFSFARAERNTVGGDFQLFGCLDALNDAGRRCPKDGSLVGFNDMPFVDKINPPLTTVRVPQYELGRRAAELLLERLRGAHVDGQLVDVELVVRGSTAPPRRGSS